MSSNFTTSDIVNKVYLFCEELAGSKLFAYQSEFAKRIIRAVITGEGAELTALFSRQCIKKGSMVHTRDGKVMRIEEVPGAWKSFDSKECFRVHVKGGYSVYATANHPIYTKEGWKFVEDLKVGDYVAVLDEWNKFGDGKVPYHYSKYRGTSKREFKGTIEMTDDLAELLGWITTDGSFSPRQSPKFTNTNMDCINRVKELVEKLFPNISPKLYTKGNGWDLLLTTGNKGIHNPIQDFLKKMDFDEEAEFPKALNYFTRSQLIAYFRAAFSCDGYAHVKRSGKDIEIGGLGSSNHFAYTDFHRELLNKLGISGNIKSELMAKNKDGKKFNRIVISGQHNASKFIEVFGDIIGKNVPDISEKLSRILAYENFKDEDGEILTFKQITSIKSDGNHEVWDMEVTEKGWFICGGVKVHNSGKSFTVSVVMSGLSIILPILANMPMFANDKRLQTYRKGFMLGIFAPSQKQARIIFGNIKKFLSSPHSCDILTDPEINIIFEVSNGENVSMKFKNLGISSKISCITASETANIEGESCMVVVVDEAQDVADFVYKKSIFPMGAFYNATYVLIGTSTTKRGFFYESIENNKKEYANGEIKKSHFENDYKTVEKYNENYKKHVEGAKKKLGEDSDEFKMSYKLMWLLSRGMFITSERLDAIADTSADIYLSDKTKTHVAGIDLGKSKDSTVITILEVDWENPVIIEESKDPDVPDFAVYSTMIKHWTELQGDDWNEQESDILQALEPFEISKVVIDATGVGSSVFDHLNVVLSQRGVEAIPYAFSTQSKSALFKFLDSQIKGGRAKYPACANLQEDSREYKRFVEQMSILEKSYSGQHMVCAAPNNTKAHDDYPVSWALAQWAARGEPGVKVAVMPNNIFKQPSSKSSYYYGRNRYTARR